MIFRIDDVSLNTDQDGLAARMRTILERVPRAHFMLAISPLVYSGRVDLAHPDELGERCFPRRWNALSDHRVFYQVTAAGLPPTGIPFAHVVSLASHGLVHVDHRLLGREAQELSILASCSLVGTKRFVPPFNKYNADTIAICREHGIELVQFEHGWRHVRHNAFDPEHSRYYFHTHDTSPEWFSEWFDEAQKRTAAA